MMTPTSSVYSGMISARSRRIRTIGTVLLTSVVLMTLYGFFGLMPAIHRAAEARHAAQAKWAAAHPNETPAPAPAGERPTLTRAQQVEKLQVATVFAYWGVCMLLVIATLFVAWLDLREISRNYLLQRRQLWTQAADRMGQDNSPPEGTAGGPERN
jgi:hypothetical protein